MLKQHGYLRVGALVPELEVGNVKFNVKEIVRLIKQANKMGVQVATLPELSITGYTCGDLFHQDLLINESINGLGDILKATTKLDVISIVGLPLRLNNQLFNVAAVINRGKILGIIPKTFIPNYQEFYEKRWFAASGLAISKEIKILGSVVPFGTNLIFKDQTNGDFAFAVEICEDLWNISAPSINHSLNGAAVIFNLSASNEIIGKYEYRRNLIKQHSAKCIGGYVYASSGINESSTDLVFSGHALIAETGTILQESERFTFDSQIIAEDLDINRIMNNRQKAIGLMEGVKDTNYRQIEFDMVDNNIHLLRRYSKTPFVPSNSLKRNQRCEEIINIQASGLAKRLKHTRIDKTVIGISGGLDSTLAFLVIVAAYKKLGISSKNIIAVLMPGFGTTDRTYQNALKLVQHYGTSVKEISIKAACLQHFKDLTHNPNQHDITYENTQARERTQILMDLANQENALVIGTGDLSELALGWCTYNGDHMSMYAVNSSIPKTLIQYLVGWVAETNSNKVIRDILFDIIDTPISPELLPPDEVGNITQHTEDHVGPYILHDFFLFHFLRYGATPAKILFLANQTFKAEYTEPIIQEWLIIFLKRFFSQQFKRSCLPDGPKVGTVSLSPRGDWRMPSDASYKVWINSLSIKKGD